jgi:hypothetical protein
VFAFGILVLLSNVVSTFWYQHQIQYHYSVMLAPVVVLAAIHGVTRLRTDRARAAATTVVVLCAVWSGYLWGPFPVSRRPTVFGNPKALYVADANALLRHVPKNAVVSAFYGYIPHLAHRKELYQFPVPFKAEYWKTFKQEGKELTDLTPHVEYIAVPMDLGEEPQKILDRVKPEFEVVARVGNAVLYKRIKPPQRTVPPITVPQPTVPQPTVPQPTVPQPTVPATTVAGPTATTVASGSSDPVPPGSASP